MTQSCNLPVCNGHDFLVVDGSDFIGSGRESILEKSDVSCEICVVVNQLPLVVPKLDAVPLAISVVAQTWTCPDLPLPGASSPSMMTVWTYYFPDGSPPC